MTKKEIIAQIELMNEWERVIEEAKAEVEAIKDSIKAEMADRDLDELEAGKTKEIVKVLENLKAAKKTLIVTKEKNELVCRAANNIPTVNTGIITAIGVYDIVNCDSLVVTEAAVRKVEEVYSL